MGTAEITVTAGGISDTCTVNVVHRLPEGLILGGVTVPAGWGPVFGSAGAPCGDTPETCGGRGGGTGGEKSTERP
jgi:hypothetical protein